MSELNEAVKKAIAENLSGAVAGQLKDFIADAEHTKEQLKEVTRQKEDWEQEAIKLRPLQSEQAVIERKTKEIAEKEIELKIKEEILKLREQHAKDRVGEIRDLTNTVFRSNRMNYNVDFSMPLGKDQYGCDQYGTVDGKITKNDMHQDNRNTTGDYKNNED